MARSAPDPMDKGPKPYSPAPATPASRPRKGMKDYGTSDEMVKWHNMPYAERVAALRAGTAPSFVAVSSIASRLKYLARLIAMQEQGLLPGKNAQPGINQKPPPPVGPAPTAKPASKPKGPPNDRGPMASNIQRQMPSWYSRMVGHD